MFVLAFPIIYSYSSHMLCYAILCYAMLFYVMQCYSMLCNAMLFYVMLCYDILSYAMICYVMICYVIKILWAISKIWLLPLKCRRAYLARNLPIKILYSSDKKYGAHPYNHFESLRTQIGLILVELWIFQFLQYYWHLLLLGRSSIWLLLTLIIVSSS